MSDALIIGASGLVGGALLALASRSGGAVGTYGSQAMRILMLALILSLSSFGAWWNQVLVQGEVSLAVFPVDPKAVHEAFGGQAPDTPGVGVTVMTRNPDTTAFKLILRYESQGEKRTETAVLPRGVNMPVSTWSWHIFYIGRVKVLSVAVEELKRLNDTEFPLDLTHPNAPHPE